MPTYHLQTIVVIHDLPKERCEVRGEADPCRKGFGS